MWSRYNNTICASLQEISLGFSLNFPSAFPEHFKFQASSSDCPKFLKTLFLSVLSPPEGAKHIFWLSGPGTNFHQVKQHLELPNRSPKHWPIKTNCCLSDHRSQTDCCSLSSSGVRNSRKNACSHSALIPSNPSAPTEKRSREADASLLK